MEKQRIKEHFLISIKIRWYVFGTILAFFVLSLAYFSITDGFSISIDLFWPYLLVVLFLGLSNITLIRFFERISHLKSLIQTQIVFDIILASVLLFLAGGIISWFWVIYPILIFETAFLFDGGRETFEAAFFSSLAFLFVLLVQSSTFVSQTSFPFTVVVPAQFSVYATIISFWVIIVNILAAFTGNYLFGITLEKENELNQRVIKDGLTGLYNHSYFYNILEAEMKRSMRYGRTFSLILIDIDNFKDFNDRFGHQEGDLLLMHFSDLLVENIRKKDVDLVFRYGGEEFAVIAPEISAERGRVPGAVALAERLRKKVLETLPISISIGVGSFPIHGDNADELFKKTDEALFTSKRQGKNRITIASRTQEKKIA